MRFFFLFLIFPLLLRAGELTTLEELTAQWVTLRAEQAREREAWRDEQSRLRLESSLLDNAEKRLQDELNTLQSGSSQTEADQSLLLRELAERQAALAALRPDLDTAYARLLEKVKTLPAPLRQLLNAELQAAESAPAEPVQRLRVTLALHNELLALQNAIHSAPMRIELNGERREMEVLWIGTRHAFAAGAEGDLAAIGTQSAGVWQWREQPGLAPRIRLALRIARGEAAPTLVPLPVELKP